ncbi:MAG: metallophosphoesterase [Coprobacillaceae bacterium]
MVTNSYDLTVDNPTGETMCVVQISDLHISKNYTADRINKIVEEINEKSPDIVIFTGDLFDNYAVYGPTEEVIQNLSKIEATYGKYAIWGNHDYGGGASKVYEETMSASGFTLLSNTGEAIELSNKQVIFIGGLDDSLLGNPNIANIQSLMQEEYAYSILLTHEPDSVDLFQDIDMDLVLSGHSHGGQIYIPGIELVKTSMAQNYTSGFYTINEGTELYVNTGIGTTKIAARFLVPPEIAVFNIKI